MRFLISWLANYVDLDSRIGIARDAAGRSRLQRLTPEARESIASLGQMLTNLGLAVEDYPIHVTGGEQEPLLEVEVTSNRPDCMNHYGLAREIAAKLGTALRPPAFSLPESSSSKASSHAKVVIEDAEGCPRFVSRVIRGAKLGPSPPWLVRRLEAIGLRSIHNVVDATNYVLWELGQPLHAYDLGTVPGGELHVRRARAGEKLTTLDGKERALDPEILVIADRTRAVGLAGIMGGLATEVTPQTTDVLLESAHFDRRRVRTGAKRLALHTDASHRFERGSDPELCDFASRRCAALIVEISGGDVAAGAVDAAGDPIAPIAWRLDKKALDRFAGVDVTEAEIERILTALEFSPRRIAAGVFEGTVPSFRLFDFEPRRKPLPGRPSRDAYAQDVFEEVLRHFGFEKIPASLPALAGVDAGGAPDFDRRSRVQRLFAGLGFAEAIHFAFQDEASDMSLPVLVAAGRPLPLANPLSERYAVMRRSLVPNLVNAAELNLRRGAAGVRLFEVGHLFPGGESTEIDAVAAVMGGPAGDPWDRAPEADLLSLKGCFESVLAELCVVATAAPVALPGIVAGTGALWRVEEEIVGYFGRIDRSETTAPLFAGELLLDRLPSRSRPREIKPPSRFPGVAVDITFTHALAIAWREIAAALESARVLNLAAFRLKDRYQGAGVPAGAVNTTIAFDFVASDRSLTQDEVNQRRDKLAALLDERFGWRSAGEAT